MFNSESKTTGRQQVDVSGLIGQYAQTNRVITWPILAITLQT
jgi:hypothetical protein